MDNSEWQTVESILNTADLCVATQSPGPDATEHAIQMIDAFAPGRHNDLARSHPSQVLTPPDSDGSASGTASEREGVGQDKVDDEPQNTVVSVSTTFHPSANLLPIPTDFVLISSDEVFFYVHTTQVLSVSSNHFNNTVLRNPTKSDDVRGGDYSPLARVPEPSLVLNIILHCAYGLSCATYKPSLDVLVAAVDAMPSYGLSPKMLVAPATSIYGIILAQAPMRPLHVYALASRHDLYELAKPVSSYLHALTTEAFTEEWATRIAPIYLKRLYILRKVRLEALKRVLRPPPHIHPSTPECDFLAQKQLARAWALATAYLAWEDRADLSPSAIHQALSPLADHLPCQLCKQTLADRVKQLLAQWSFVQRTI